MTSAVKGLQHVAEYGTKTRTQGRTFRADSRQLLRSLIVEE